MINPFVMALSIVKTLINKVRFDLSLVQLLQTLHPGWRDIGTDCSQLRACPGHQITAIVAISAPTAALKQLLILPLSQFMSSPDFVTCISRVSANCSV